MALSQSALDELLEAIRLVLASTVGDRYRVRMSDDGCTVGLWRP